MSRALGVGGALAALGLLFAPWFSDDGVSFGLWEATSWQDVALCALAVSALVGAALAVGPPLVAAVAASDAALGAALSAWLIADPPLGAPAAGAWLALGAFLAAAIGLLSWARTRRVDDSGILTGSWPR